MGLIVKQIKLEDYVKKNILYSKLIRGNLNFFIETHHLDKGKHLQIFLYRTHPRIKDFIEGDKKKHYLTQQINEIQADCNEIRLYINDNTFMLNGAGPVSIKITEYNFNKQLADFDKGKVAVLIDMVFNDEADNSKTLSDLKVLNQEDQNNDK